MGNKVAKTKKMLRLKTKMNAEERVKIEKTDDREEINENTQDPQDNSVSPHTVEEVVDNNDDKTIGNEESTERESWFTLYASELSSLIFAKTCEELQSEFMLRNHSTELLND